MAQFSVHFRDLARSVGVVIADGIATAGGAATLTDATYLGGSIYPTDKFAGCQVYIWLGTGAGQYRTVTASNASTGALTVNANWTTQPSTDSQYFIMQLGWNRQTLGNAFLQAMYLRKKYLLLPKEDESLTLVASTYEYTVPTGFMAIQTILRESEAGSGIFTQEIPHDFWRINKEATRQIIFDKRADDVYHFLVAGCKLHITGQQYETIPPAAGDTGTVSVATGVLLLLATWLAHMQAAPADASDLERRRALAEMAKRAYDACAKDEQVAVWPGSKLVEEQ